MPTRKQPWTRNAAFLFVGYQRTRAVRCLLQRFAGAQDRNRTRVAGFWPEFAQAERKYTLCSRLSIRRGLAAHRSKGMFSITYPPWSHARKTGTDGRRNGTVIHGTSDFSLRTGSANWPEATLADIGRKTLPSRLLSIFGSVCRERKRAVATTLRNTK